MFVEAHVLEAPVVVEYVQPTPVVEYMANACTTQMQGGVRDSSIYRCLSGPSDHIDSGADSLRNCDSAGRHGANRHYDSVEDTPVAQQSSLLTAQTVQKLANVPQVQYSDKVVEVPVVMQRPVPIFPTVQKTTEVPQCIDKAVDVPGLMQRQIPMIQKAEMTVENPQFQSFNCVVDVPVMVRRQVPLVQRVQNIVEVPQIQFIDKWTRL